MSEGKGSVAKEAVLPTPWKVFYMCKKEMCVLHKSNRHLSIQKSFE